MILFFLIWKFREMLPSVPKVRPSLQTPQRYRHTPALQTRTFGTHMCVDIHRSAAPPPRPSFLSNP